MKALAVAGIFHLWYFGVARPLATWRDYRRIQQNPQPRPPLVEYYKYAVPNLWSCGILSVVTAASLWMASSRVPGDGYIFVFDTPVGKVRDIWSGLFPAVFPAASSWLLGLAALVVMLAIDLPYTRRSRQRGDRQGYLGSPRTGQERLWWVGLSFAAGISEEITWRGVQPELIAQATGRLWPAILICTLTFGIGHIKHGWPWIAGAGLFGLMFHGLAWVTGSLYVGMAVHVAVNVVCGLVGPRGDGRAIRPTD